ncbi:transketolase [Flagelloscypha sp. PMI_526]|nr:transketolase [Flagelloscypha sp. PMI_526]
MAPVPTSTAPPSVDSQTDPKKDLQQHILNTIRCLTADLVQEYKGGHPGTAMGAASIGMALWKYSMRFNPKNPEWFNRDRFVLSAGHACLLQYIYLHFTGYEAWTMDVLRSYHSPKYGIAAGHPEIEFPGCEVTTGPLGQGLANATGLAIAAKNLAATYNKPNFPIVDNKIWAFTGDGCLQEGVGQEAMSLAGHLRLDNLIVIYDDNAITVDGGIDSCFTDDTDAKMKANGFEIIRVEDGTNDVASIVEAFEQARAVKDKPVFVHIKTIIVHGAALGTDDVKHVKNVFGFNPDAKASVGPEIYDYFKPVISRGQQEEDKYNKMYAEYKSKYPNESAELEQRKTGDLPDGWKAELPTKDQLPTEAIATRKASGLVIKSLVPKYRNFMVGSADLMESTFVNWKDQVEFQHPVTQLGDYSGRQIRYGIREFAMTAIANGMAAFHHGMIIPVCSTFFMFWLYAAPAARMSALQHLRFIGIATHDCIGIGEDGPTHQPVALANFYRSLPNFNFIRPADAEETMGAWELALDPSNNGTPSLLSLTRHAIPLLQGSDRAKVALGAYTIFETSPGSSPSLVIVATGSEVNVVIKAAERIASNLSTDVRVVSMPSMAHFDKQPAVYRKDLLCHGSALVVAVEAWCSHPWAKYAHASMSMHTFGLSAPCQTLFDTFGFGFETVAEKITAYAKPKLGKALPGVGEFEELLADFAKDVHSDYLAGIPGRH